MPRGKVVAELAKSDLTKFDELGLKKAEMFTYKAADGKTTLHGLIQFPSNFDPSRKYPVLVPVYGGPASASNTARETFVTPNAMAEYGFLIVNLDSRAAPGMGKRTLDSIYLKLGQVEIDDMAEGVKSLCEPAVRRQGARRHLRHVVRRLLVGDVDPAASGCLRRGVGLVAGDGVEPLRQHLHRALHVDPAGEQGGLRRRQRHDLRRTSSRAG